MRGLRILLVSTCLVACPSVSWGQSITTRLQDVDGGYSGTRDVVVQEHTDPIWDPNANYDQERNAVDGYPNDKSTLLRWDLSSIPTNTQINAADIEISITGSTVFAYEIYELLRPWSAAEATWNIARTGSPWAQPGGFAVGSDRGADVLGTFIGEVGTTRLTLNAAGVAVVQKWIASPGSNHGFIVEDVTAADSLAFRNSADGTPTLRPALRIRRSDNTRVTFQNGVAPSAAYAGQEDTIIVNGFEPGAPGANANGAGLSAGGRYPRSAVLLAFDVSAIPADARVVSASLTLGLSNGSADAFPLFGMTRPWSEGQATWFTSDGVDPWAAPGIDSTADHEATSIAEIPTTSGVVGPVQIPFNGDGVALVQAWVDGSTANNGVVILNHASDDTLFFAERNSPDASRRPALEVTWFPAPDAGPITVPDAGMTEEPDAGPTEEPDAGPAEEPDAGPSEEMDGGVGDGRMARSYSVGCSSSGTAFSAHGLVALTLLAGGLRWKRRRQLARRT